MQGFESYGSNGLLKLSITDRLPKIAGSVRILSNGSISYYPPQGNEVFVMFVADYFLMDKSIAYPSIKVAGGYISWSYDNRDYPALTYAPGTIVYGYY